MSSIRMALEGDESVGWSWHVWVEEWELFRTKALGREDLGSALFSIQRDASRKNPYFQDIADDQLFLILEGFFFGSLYDALRASAEEQIWARHLVSPSIPVTIWSQLFLIGGDGGQERLLVSQDGHRRTFILPEGEFDKQLKGVIERLESSLPVPQTR